MSQQLTLKQLKAMEPDTIFATGTMVDSPTGLHMAGTGKKLRWVAVRGGIHDWAIYAHFHTYDENWVRLHGDKVTYEKHIRKLVNCTDEAFGMYRY